MRDRAARRREVMETFARMLDVPPETKLAIAVDVDLEHTRFQILDKETGEILKEIPEEEGASLLRRLMRLGAHVVDERF